MKRIVLILSALVMVFWVTFALQNRFLLGVIFIQNGKTSSADLDHLLGKHYFPVAIDASPPGMAGRMYVVHYASYIICDYNITWVYDSMDRSKDHVDSIRWEKWMDWNKGDFLDSLERASLHN